MALADASPEQDPPLALGWVTWREEPQSLADAQRQGALVVFDGDAGEETYVIAPAGGVHCTEEKLRELLYDLDSQAGGWGDDKPRIQYRRGSVEAPDDAIGVMEQGIWIESEFSRLGLGRPIREVLEGRRDRIPRWRKWANEFAGAVGGIVGFAVGKSLGLDFPASAAVVIGLGAVGIGLAHQFLRTVLFDR